MARVRSTTNTTNAAFSKSVSCTSRGRNSTLQPMLELGGGGLKRMLCQLVDWIFCSEGVSRQERGKGGGGGRESQYIGPQTDHPNTDQS